MKGFNKQLFLEILERYNSGKASKEEVQYLEAYYNMFEINRDFLNDENEQNIKDSLKLKIDHQINLHESKSVNGKLNERGTFKMSFQRYAAAAVALIVLSVGTYFIVKKEDNSSLKLAAYNDLSPGGNKAILTLANGKKIVLDGAANGEIAKQPGIRISKTADGQIVYTVVAEEGVQNNTAFNTISTPKGGQYQVVLPDGTRVWLNSASSLKYPAAFSGNRRLVELNGEAYFEVAKVFINNEPNATNTAKRQSFIVKTDKQEVEVLGTHFNISAYDDEPVLKTTLLEGSVKVSYENSSNIIIPGQQVKVYRSGAEPHIINNINIDKEIAWKNGIFSFENDDLKTIMRQISRWYNLNVVYSGSLPDEKFYGEISRNSNLSEVFKILELNNVQFEIEGKTVTVSSNSQNSSK